MLPQNKCTGCFACESACPQNCITCKTDKEGFNYPVINNDACIHCKKCERVCPVIKSEGKPSNEELPLAFAAKNRNRSIQNSSSSGGVFSALAEYVIHSGGTVYGAAFDDSFKVKHVSVSSLDKLSVLRGSKYVQSDVRHIFPEIKKNLNDGKSVLFSGTPCQAAGLKGYLGRDYDNLLLVDIVCHGVPSPKVWETYLEFVAHKHGDLKIKCVSFRDKCTGWENFSFSCTFENGTKYTASLSKDPYMKMFLKNYCLRNSCYDCNFKSVNHVSDITLGDFWGINTVSPELFDNNGVSVVFVHSSKGESILQSLINEIQIAPIDCKKAIEHNGAMLSSVYRQPMREYFLNKVNGNNFEKLSDNVISPNILTRIDRKIRFK